VAVLIVHICLRERPYGLRRDRLGAAGVHSKSSDQGRTRFVENGAVSTLVIKDVPVLIEHWAVSTLVIKEVRACNRQDGATRSANLRTLKTSPERSIIARFTRDSRIACSAGVKFSAIPGTARR
jgi:hypothetical protein